MNFGAFVWTLELFLNNTERRAFSLRQYETPYLSVVSPDAEDSADVANVSARGVAWRFTAESACCKHGATSSLQHTHCEAPVTLHIRIIIISDQTLRKNETKYM